MTSGENHVLLPDGRIVTLTELSQITRKVNLGKDKK